jgi:hypothetical protein
VAVGLLIAARLSVAEPAVPAAAESPPAAKPQEYSPTVIRASQLAKTLDWKGVNWDALAMRDRCRTLLFMSHVLGKIDEESAARAELLSDYIDEKEWGPQFMQTRGPDEPTAISYAEAQKLCSAVLKGPLAGSRHATDLTDVPDNTLDSYYRFYEKTAARRWAEVAETRHLVRAASAFLRKKGVWADYLKWSTAEATRRQEAYEKEMSARRAAAQAKQEANEAKRRELEEKARIELQVAQNALQATTDFGSWNQVTDANAPSVGFDDDDSYAGWNYNDGWGWTNAWYTNPGYVAISRDRVEHHMNGWRGGGGGGRIGGGRRR